MEKIRYPPETLVSPSTEYTLAPLIFFTYPVLSLIRKNYQEIYLEQTVRIVLVCFFAALILLLLLSAFLRNFYKGAIATTIIGLIFFSYGHIYSQIHGIELLGQNVGRHRYLLALSIVIWIVLIVIVQRQTQLTNVTYLFNIVGFILCLFPVISSSRALLLSRNVASSRATRIPNISLHENRAQSLPDIYYIILDGYARADYMYEEIGYDNSQFLQALNDMGFYIADESRANHNYTTLSLASSLNMTLSQYLGAKMVKGDYPDPFAPFIQNSLVRKSLEGIGYSTISFRSGYKITEIPDADIFLSPDEKLHMIGGRLNAFEDIFLHTTLLKPFLEKGLLTIQFGSDKTIGEGPASSLREIILYAFNTIPHIPDTGTPKFIFAHIIALHYPYIFDRDGNAVSSIGDFTFIDSGENLPEKALMYREQAIFISNQVLELVRNILVNSVTPPVIIIQADHGSGVVSGKAQRTAIFNAILIDEQCRDHLYSTLSPINTFRIVFNCYFNADIPLVDDEIYWSEWPRYHEYKFQLLP